MTMLSCVLLLLAAASASATVVVINNTRLHHDDRGQIMDAHDGNIIQYEAGGPYYFYAMSYGNCREASKGCGGSGGDPGCGFRTDHNVSVWSSPTMADGTWHYLGSALPVDGRPAAIYYRPKVKYNPTTKLYVLWTNAVPAGDFSRSFDVAATSTTPQGPFTVKNANVTLAHKSPGDFDLFADDDGTAYLIYTDIVDGHVMTIEKLAPDWLSSTLQSSGTFGASFVESPAMFKRGSVYYALFGHCCCFCEEGSGVVVHTASHPLGPWTTGAQIGAIGSQSITHAQQNCVFPVRTKTGTEWLWTGDRWQSAPDKIKSHDLQFWTPLVFNDTEPVPSISVFRWIDSFTVDVE